MEEKLNASKIKLFTIILTCEKYEHKMLSQDTSKLSDYMYFIGDPTLSSPLVNGDIVYLPCPDNYESLTLKTLMAIKWVVENKEFDLLLKTDDDVTFLDSFDELVCEASNYDYCGALRQGDYVSTWHRGKCENKVLDNAGFLIPQMMYCHGGGYFLSRKSALLLANKEIRENHSIYEDVEVGDLLQKFGIIAKGILAKEGIFWP